MFSTNTSYAHSSAPVITGQPESKLEKQALKEKVNEQQQLMNTAIPQKRRTVSSEKLHSHDLEGQSEKTHSLAIYDKENSPFFDTEKFESLIENAVNSGIPHKYICALNELFQNDKIDRGQFVELLGADPKLISETLLPFLHDPELFAISIPLLEVLSSESLFSLLTTKNSCALTLLDDRQIFLEAIPLLEKWDREWLDKIFITFTGRLSRQYWPLRDPEVVKAVFCLFNKASPDVAAKFFCVLVSCGSSFCGREKAWVTIMPSFIELEPKTVVRIFRALAEQGVWTYPLLFPNVLTAGIPLLESMKADPETLVEFFSILNENGRSFLHSPKVFEAAIPFLKELPSDLLIRILSIRNDEGNPFWMFIVEFKKLIPLFEGLSRESLIGIFSIANSNGEIPLNDPEMFQAMIPFFEKLDEDTQEDTLIGILSIVDAQECIVLNNLNVLKVAIAFLQTRKNNLLVRILTIETVIEAVVEDVIETVKVWTLLHDPDVFKMLLPLLETREDEVLIGIFSVKDSEGWTPLDYWNICKLAIPVFKTLRLDNRWDLVLRLLSNRNLHGTACVFDPKVFTALIPFLMELGKDELLEVFSIRSHWKTPFLMYPRMWEVMIPYFETLDSEMLIKFFSIVYSCKHFETYPEVWEKAKPFIEGLDMEVKLTLPFWQDFQYKTIMKQQMFGR